MSNTQRKGRAFIFTGIVNSRGSRNRIAGIRHSIDDNEIQNLLKRWLYPIPQVHYYERRIKNKLVGVCEIMRDQLTGPYYIRENLRPEDNAILAKNRFLRKAQLYYRRGSTNEWAREADREYITTWFRSYKDDRWQNWDEFKECCEYFDTGQHYILITSPLSHVEQSVLNSFSHISWSAVIDFDPFSDEKGILQAIDSTSTQRNIIRSVKGDIRSFSSSYDTYWFFARGLHGLSQTLVNRDDWKAWRSFYGSEIDRQFKHIASFLLPDRVTFVVVWNDDSLVGHLRSTLDSTTVFENARYVIVSDTTSRLKSTIDEEFEPRYIEIPVRQLASGLAVEFPSHEIEADEYTLPSDSGTPIRIPKDRLAWLQSQLELIHLGISVQAESDEDETDFLRGGIITWHELELRRDAERDATAKIARRVSQELRARDRTRIDMYHLPGAGGTTVSRRILWDFHRDFPCVVIRGGDSNGIVERIQFISTITGQPVLALTDSASIAEREVEDLFKLLELRNIPCVLLSVSRRHQLPGKHSRRLFNLGMRLSQSELPRFVDKFATSVPASRAHMIQAIANNGRPNEQSAFFMGLTAYGEDYRGLKSYVSNRLSGLTEQQIKLLVFLSIAYMYGQKGIPAQAFQHLLGLSSENVKLSKVFSGRQSVFDILIHEKETQEWRPIHHIVSNEILRQILAPLDADPRAWRQQLSAWGKKFIQFCGANQSITSERMLELLRRILIFRDANDVLGRELGDDARSENSRLGSFSQFIQHIPAREGRLEVLRFLTETFPDEAHFWAHLGRFQASIMENYEGALVAVDMALSFQPNDPLLWHMKGMSYRYQAQKLMSEYTDDLENVVALAERASECFEQSRLINPDREHGYISEIQLLTKVLNYATRNSEETIFQYIKRNNIPYVREAFDKAESLLAIVGSIQDGTQSSSFERSCRASISKLYGDYEEALQIWDSLLSRNDVFHPPVRRQIVYALKDRAESWQNMRQSRRDRCIRLLQDNLDEQPYYDRDLRLWLQAVRFSTHKPSIESLIEKVSYWKTNTNALDAAFYLYVLYSLQAIEGLRIERNLAERFMTETAQLSRNRQNRRRSFEWLGPGQGIARLVHQSELGNWNREINFWSNVSALERAEGFITNVRGPEAGTIQVGGLSCFFVPAGKPEEPISKDAINRRVSFFLGFSYSGIRAWDVEFS